MIKKLFLANSHHFKEKKTKIKKNKLTFKSFQTMVQVFQKILLRMKIIYKRILKRDFMIKNRKMMKIRLILSNRKLWKIVKQNLNIIKVNKPTIKLLKKMEDMGQEVHIKNETKI